MSYEIWRAGGRQLQLGKHHIFVRDFNPASAPEGHAGCPTVLMLHGFPTSSFDYETLATHLPGLTGFRCITFDFLGFGASSKPVPYTYSFDEQADIALEVARLCGVQAAHVIAHDYGATVGQELLARAIEGRCSLQLRGMLFLNGGIVPELHRPLLVQKLLAGPLGPKIGPILTNESTFVRSMNRIFGPTLQLSRAELHEHWLAVARDAGTHAMPYLLGYIAERKARASRFVGALHNTNVPLDFVWGQRDPVSGKHLYDWIEKNLPHSRKLLLEDVGHYPQLEAPSRVLAAARRFLAYP